MQSNQIQIHVESCGEPHSIKITTIKWATESITYCFLKEHQTINMHEELCSNRVVSSACNALKKKGHYRNIKVTLPPEIISLYCDEENNFVFRNHYLEEFIEEHQLRSDKSSSQTLKRELEEIIDGLARRLDRQDTAANRNQFVVQNFNGKENAAEWMRVFEKECCRNGITADENKIQTLRLFLEQNAKDWYSSTLYKLTLEGQWTDWKESFLQTYGDKNWSTIQFAYTFKYISGSVLDYAIKKERLVLETEPSMSDRSRINHVVIGLPRDIQDRIDKEDVRTTEQLMNQLRRYENIYLRDRKEPRVMEKEKRLTVKQPCAICESRGNPGRFHPVENCRFKEYRKDRKGVNMTEIEETAVNAQEQKN